MGHASPTPLRVVIASILACALTFRGSAATIDEARDRQNGKVLFGLVVEGDIELGDSDRLLSDILIFNFAREPNVVRTIYLRSRGGEVAEAMKMGKLIRRLRLEVEIPVQPPGQATTFSDVAPRDGSNNVCASACFLVFAGGINRRGNLLALHRPYISRESAVALSDVEYEANEKRALQEVREHLAEMDVNEFFVEKVLSTNSRNAYRVSYWEADHYHLTHIVPSIEEAVLLRCNPMTNDEARRIDSGAATPDERRVIFSKLSSFQDCQTSVLDEMRRAAIRRELKIIQEKTGSK